MCVSFIVRALFQYVACGDEDYTKRKTNESISIIHFQKISFAEIKLEARIISSIVPPMDAMSISHYFRESCPADIAA